MDHPVVDNPDIRSKFYNSIRPILKEQKDCIVLLNDKHANNRTSGSKLWHTAKTNEREKFPSGSVSQRVQRAKEEFKRIHTNTRTINCDPTFLRMLNVKEIDILIGETKNIAGTCSSIRNDLYKISSGKKEHIYAEATSPDVEKNVGSFRLTKRVASSKRPPINKLDDDANFDSSAKIPEMTSGALMQFLVNSCGLRSADARHHITATFLNDNRKPNQFTSKIASEPAATKSSSTNVNSIDKCLEPKAKRARPRPASGKEVCPESEPPSPNTIASGRSTPAHARDRVFEDLDDLDGADTINNLLTSLGETSAFSKRHEPRPTNRDEAIPDISDDFEFFGNTIDNLDIGLKPSDYFPN